MLHDIYCKGSTYEWSGPHGINHCNKHVVVVNCNKNRSVSMHVVMVVQPLLHLQWLHLDCNMHQSKFYACSKDCTTLATCNNACTFITTCIVTVNMHVAMNTQASNISEIN